MEIYFLRGVLASAAVALFVFGLMMVFIPGKYHILLNWLARFDSDPKPGWKPGRDLEVRVAGFFMLLCACAFSFPIVFWVLRHFGSSHGR